jgi:hypothetical protein
VTFPTLPLSLALDRRPWLARLLCRGDIAALLLGADGRLSVVRRDGARESVVLEAATTVFTALVILRMRSQRGREALAVPVSALGAEAHRRLRVWLRWRALPSLRAAV